MRLTENFANDPRALKYSERPRRARAAGTTKWAFRESVLDRIARDNRADSSHLWSTRYRPVSAALQLYASIYGGMKAVDYPAWAWNIFDCYDKETFSPRCCSISRLRAYIQESPLTFMPIRRSSWHD